MDSLTSIMTNGFVGTATSAYVDGEDGVLYIQGYNVQANGFDFHGIKRVSRGFHARNQKSYLREGDLLTIQTGDIGVTTIVPPELVGANCHALVISRFHKRSAAPEFYCHYFNAERGRAQFKEIETGSTMKHLNVGDMKLLLLPSPPVEEQRAIAEALSDVDGLLGALDRLIAKKRDLKQAAMQQLLTGQTRLPGFHGEWAVKRLGDHLEFLSNGVNSRAELIADGSVRYLHYGDIHSAKSLLLNPASTAMPFLPEDKAVRLDRLADGDLVFADASEDLDGVGKSIELQNVGQLQVVSGMHTIAVRFDKTVLADGFKTYLQMNPSFRNHLRRLAAGTKVYATNMAHIASADVRLPGTAEQTAIAQVLSDMDAELAALEQRRDKTRAIKQGMMQDLLSGRVRLI
ncbi:restriction endonuclease subunit S [Nevskia sp.]|uniref:restriction endonuclease subunit S n=1 Tax=Nevskia sp. TaxID=1929292 RepID=UPI0025EAD2B1|nr:restriction endonuclease subunit S [Nevskia sp.]